MTAVQVEGRVGDILSGAIRQLVKAPVTGLLVLVLAWLSLGIATDRWFLFASEFLPSPLVSATSFWLLMVGALLLINAEQLLLHPGVTVPETPSNAIRARRLARVTGIEALVVTGAAVAVAITDVLSAAAITRWAGTQLIWRDFMFGLSNPGPAWMVAWSAYCLLHTPRFTWLWAATAANYPSGTLKATATLASRAGRKTPWLAHMTVGTALIIAALGFVDPGLGLVTLAPLMVWPAVANRAAAHLRPDERRRE